LTLAQGNSYPRRNDSGASEFERKACQMAQTRQPCCG
jgi:hypothetical protein